MVKLVLLGGLGVGKTELIRSLSLDLKDEVLVGPTRVPRRYSIKLTPENGERTIEADVWDSSGDSKLLGISWSYLTDASCLILVFDVTRRRSLEDLNDILAKFHKVNCDRKVPMLLVGTHGDLETQREIDTGMAYSWVLRNNVRALFETTPLTALVEETSAKDAARFYKNNVNIFCEAAQIGLEFLQQERKSGRVVPRGNQNGQAGANDGKGDDDNDCTIM